MRSDVTTIEQLGLALGLDMNAFAKSSTGETTGFTAGAGTAARVDSTYTGNTGSTAYTVSDIVKALKQVGLLAP